MEGIKLRGEIESKDQKAQMCLGNKIKNNIFDLHDKCQRFFKYIAKKEKNDVDYEILLSKVDDIIFMIDMINCTIIQTIFLSFLNHFPIYRKGLSLKVSIVPSVKIIRKRLMMI